MSFKCPDCGASITDDSKFCKYCGAKIDDGTKRIEVKIDKHIEDAAEMKRASYEEKALEHQIKKENREYRHAKIKWIIIACMVAVGGAIAGISYLINRDGKPTTLFIVGLVLFNGGLLSAFISFLKKF